MTQTLRLTALADTVTRSVLAGLTLLAAVLVVVGLGRAWRARLRPQVVVYDVEPLQGLPPALVAGLSPQLRQAVRRALARESRDAVYSHAETVVKDLAVGLLVTRTGTTVGQVRRELHASVQDSLGALAAGVSGLAPKEAEGLIAMLGAALPAQRGFAVRSHPALRTVGGFVEFGLTVEFAGLGRAPDAVTTFWAGSPSFPAEASDDALANAARGAVGALLAPVALWVAIRLVATHVAPAHPQGLERIRLRGLSDDVLVGVRLQVAGQMSLYATRQDVGLQSFADQALEDLGDAAARLPGYFRPQATQAQVYERLGWAARRAAAPDGARRAFLDAVRAYERALELVESVSQTGPDMREHVRRLALRRTKCRLLSEDRAQRRIAGSELTPLAGIQDDDDTSWRDLYNGACLFAVAAAYANSPGVEQAALMNTAWRLLGLSLLLGGEDAPWERSLIDEDLEALPAQDRGLFADELRVRLAGPGTPTPEQARRVLQEILSPSQSMSSGSPH